LPCISRRRAGVSEISLKSGIGKAGRGGDDSADFCWYASQVFGIKAKSRGRVLRFAGYELDPERAELRGRNGEVIRLRPKSFDMLWLLATHAGRVLSKQELIGAVWPGVHVSEDGLFQCIREIRSALGDDRRERIRLVSGRGYMLDAAVSNGPVPMAAGRNSSVPLTAKPPTIAVMPMTTPANDPQLAEMAANVSARLAGGLARIERLRVVTPSPAASVSTQNANAASADLVVCSELQKSARKWEAQARMMSASTGEVRWSNSVAVSADEGDLALQQSRLAAGLGHPLALRINALQNSAALMQGGGEGELPDGYARVVIEQAAAIINQTTRERFYAAQDMLEKALAADPDNVDLQVALASHLLRGIQSLWYDPADVAATEGAAQALLERALQTKPDYIPVLEAYCRFQTATNRLSESLIACGRVLSFDPWHGIALFNLGITQILQGRFEEALATFRQADAFDTPQFARWTWLLGAGLVCMLMERYQEALPWLERSLAITPGTGRTHFVLAAVYQQLGRNEDARAAIAKGFELRPHSTTGNVALSRKNASPLFVAASERFMQILTGLGLPSHRA
jgi:DNA-binding winged helix-turn-helix (wHTH) protein/tetratricopeptide (TPR) repeat protein